MYYHSRQLKYVCHDKVLPAPEETIDGDFIKAYQWLGKYCGFCPQIWLSRSRSQLTGYKNVIKSKKQYIYGSRKNKDPLVMFGFDIIKGFPVSFDIWEMLLTPLINCKDPVKDGDQAIIRYFMQHTEWSNKDGEDDDVSILWKKYLDLKEILSKELFVEKDQVVVPSLNLKAAKAIFCRNEKQVKKLRHMGFIEDRIQILNSKAWEN